MLLLLLLRLLQLLLKQRHLLCLLLHLLLHLLEDGGRSRIHRAGGRLAASVAGWRAVAGNQTDSRRCWASWGFGGSNAARRRLRCGRRAERAVRLAAGGGPA